ncbi:MAG: aminotransferase class V-fold PLP-dependent enzyme [Paracoccus sp. (in: a-proteobacteria)]|uniref:pyridoxal-phosphate-dependent aminotransferase family protein n=1 Tax=Paracoccus sp. TaxID=267 RepID=UPI0026DF727E|nr:aminotransferase class V-fold PLP-dependent enzyme [Paracoccus sp. (in: a-proteobacteria)]MDO5620562.1 aminotransferase class V-fold PLP-dependent enzyme [Paracoccus sp. (in: a-proteobacteria)]
MPFAQGHAVLSIPGPSNFPERVLRAMARPAPDIYGPALMECCAGAFSRLKDLAGTQANIAAYIGNGHAVWEAATANILNRGEKALVLVNGLFGSSWADMARKLGVTVEEITSNPGQPADPTRLTERLAMDKAGEIKAVLVCQVDTASSVRNDIPALRAAMGDHPALLAVDAIAALGCEAMQMDAWGVDVLVSSSQKGLMTPPGLGFVWFSDRARRRGDLATPYWDWEPRIAPDALWQAWGGTPPVQLIYALEEALKLMAEEGETARLARHDAFAQAVWAAFDAWGKGTDITLNVPAPAARARSVTAARLPGAGRLRDWTSTHTGVTLGVALGTRDPQNALRIGHMGHLSAHGLLGTLAVMETGMKALAIPHGPGGVDAAMSRLAALAG